MKRLDDDILKSGALAGSLDALEATEFFGSGEPRDLYALYIQRQMLDRARSFRMSCGAKLEYMDYYFDMVDKNPGVYLIE